MPGANEPVEMSEFGMITNLCSNYCREKDGLELWLELVNECNHDSITTLFITVNNEYKYGVLCSMIALLMYLIGYFIGNLYKRNSLKLNNKE